MTQSTQAFRQMTTAQIDEIHSKVTLYEHVKTKAQLLSVENSDENKSFGITFRTPPSDSSGIAHIMEHSVLCGSKHFPLKEPFIELVKGSLNTFLNALTYPDKTTYPVASTNEKDFYNLVRVYLDAVFFPLLSKETLMQEGWHLHQEKSGDAVSIRGIVYNEMKGAYSSPDRALWDTIQASLLPDTPYRHDSGGDPLHIPELTYEKFVQFHENYYHPSNALLFFAGNDAIAKRLSLADEYLSSFSFKEINSQIQTQPTFTEPKTVTAPLAISSTDDPKKKGMVTLNWMLSPSTEVDTALRLRMLSYILMGTAASPLRKALIDSGIGEDIAGGGVESDLKQLLFSCGLRGMDSAKATEVSELILDTLKKLVREGIDKTIIEAAMNTAEFHLREHNTGSFPRGLSLMFGALPSWLHGGDPIAALSFKPIIERLQKEIGQGKPVFESLIQTYFLDNPHRTTVILEPDATENERRAKKEQIIIDTHLQKLTQNEKEELIPESARLQALQTKADAENVLATLPKLTVADLEKKNTAIPFGMEEKDGISIMTHALPTNEITYIDAAFDFHSVPESLLPLLPLFTRCLVEMGTKTQSFEDFIHRQTKDMGAISVNLLTSARYQAEGTLAYVLLRAKWLPHQQEAAKQIILDALVHANLANKERFLQMLLEEKSEMEQDVVESGHQFADSRIRSQIHESDWLDEKLSGIDQLFFLKDLIARAESDWDSVQKDLEFLRDAIIGKSNVIWNITTEEKLLDAVSAAAVEITHALQESKQQNVTWGYAPTRESQILVATTTVNYVGKGIGLYEHGMRFHGSNVVIARYLRASWLWEQVRMKGGAYGAFSSFDPLTGIFSFVSYRDPHISETLAAFDATVEFLEQITLSEDERTKAIIGAISDYDRYMLPDAKGFASFTRYLAGMTEERRQQTRDEILATTQEDFRKFAQYLRILRDKGIIVVTTGDKTFSLPGAKVLTVG